jgi:hypothetical protein
MLFAGYMLDLLFFLEDGASNFIHNVDKLYKAVGVISEGLIIIVHTCAIFSNKEYWALSSLPCLHGLST